MEDRMASAASQHSQTLSYPSSPLCKRPSSTTPTPKNNVDLKVIILGNGGVGKTSFIYRYIHDNFAETISTIGASFVLKKWKSFYLGIWDTAGQEKFSRISSYYSRGAQAAILAYDLTDRRTLDNLGDYIQFLNEAERDCYIVLVGTKLDLVREDATKRQVTEEMVQEFAKQFGVSSAPSFETSARDGVNVSGVFDTIGYHCFAERLASAPETTVSDTRPSSQLVPTSPRPPARSTAVCSCTIQ